MKRHIAKISLMMVVVMVFTACRKDDDGLISLNAEITNYAGNSNSKMYVDGERYTHWTSGDQVNINDRYTTCSVDLNGDKAKITSVPESNTGYRVVYPAGIASYFNSASIDVILPSSQTYSVDGSGNQIINAPMYGYCANGNTTLTFHNLCSLLRVTVNNDRTEDITMQSITVTSSSRKLSGAGYISGVTSDSPYLTMGSGATSYDYVTLDFSGSTYTVSQGTSKDYYIVVPAFATSDITVSIVATGAGTLELDKTASDAALSANSIVQGPTLALNGVAYVGTEGNPYKINNLDDLVAFRTNVNGGTTYEGLFVKLMADIDCGASSWTPIGNSESNPFKGTFIGNNKTITYSINVSSGSYYGLFGYVTSGAIKDLTVECSISNTYQYGGRIGGIASNISGSTISNCIVNGTINSAASYNGGIVGQANLQSFTIEECTSNVKIISTKGSYNYSGGIVGYVTVAGTISNCTATDSLVITTKYVGGIVGDAGLSSGTLTIEDCNFSGAIKGGSEWTGMIVGHYGNWSRLSVSGCHYKRGTTPVILGVGKSGDAAGEDKSGIVGDL